MIAEKREVPVAPDFAGRDLASRATDRPSEHLVHEEIARLPDSFRKPLVLCCLQGLSYDLAAQQLGVNHVDPAGPSRACTEKGFIRGCSGGAFPFDAGGPSIAPLPGSLPPLPSALVEATVQFSLRWSRLTGLLGGGTAFRNRSQRSHKELSNPCSCKRFEYRPRSAGRRCDRNRRRGSTRKGPRGRRRCARSDRRLHEQARNHQARGIERSPRPAGWLCYLRRLREKGSDGQHQPANGRPAADEDDDPRCPLAQYISATPKGASNSHQPTKESTARILKTANATEPIRIGDIVYASGSPNRPTRFALVGKIDVNRDSKDDREELKRMIQEAGGVVDFDLPPTDLGKESGELNPRIDWYVVDDRPPLREFGPQPKPEKRVGEVIKAARLNGIRPMTIGKLLAYLGQEGNAQAPVPSATFNKPAPASPARDARVRQKLEMVIDVRFRTRQLSRRC